MAPSDEYDSYAPHIVTIVVGGASADEVAAHLSKLRTETIGVGANPKGDREIAVQIVAALSRSVV
jgi:hypothetical protein